MQSVLNDPQLRFSKWLKNCMKNVHRPSHLHPIPTEQNTRRDVADQNGPIKMKEVEKKFKEFKIQSLCL